MADIRDDSHYQYDEYTTGRKQDYGHHELNEENGWVCYEWDRGDYTETMQMKKPKEGKGWKPFRVYWYVSTFVDFMKIEDAQAYFDNYTKSVTWGHASLIEVDTVTGKEVKKWAVWPEPPKPVVPEPPKPLPAHEVHGFISFIAEMLSKEQAHLKYIESVKNPTPEIEGFIARSKQMIEHFTVRLQEYKDYEIKHYGEPATT